MSSIISSDSLFDFEKYFSTLPSISQNNIFRANITKMVKKKKKAAKKKVQNLEAAGVLTLAGGENRAWILRQKMLSWI